MIFHAAALTPTLSQWERELKSGVNLERDLLVTATVSRRGSARHRRVAVPAVLKSTFDFFMALRAVPVTLRQRLQCVDQGARGLRMFGMAQPDFGQTLINRQFASG